MLNPGYGTQVYEQTPGAMQFYPANAFVNTPPAYEFIPHRVFVGGFPINTTENELRGHFEKHFRIREAKVIRSPEGVSKGYGFITFENEEEAEAVKNMSPQKLEFKGRKLNLGPALRRMSTNRYIHPEYAVATPTGLVQPGQVFTYPVAKSQPPFVLMHPHYVPSGGFLFNNPSAFSNGHGPQQLLYDHSMTLPQGGPIQQNGNLVMNQHQQPHVQHMMPQQDPVVDNSGPTGVDVPYSTAMNQFNQSQSPPSGVFCYPPYSYYVQPSTPVTPSQAPMSRVPCATNTVGSQNQSMQAGQYYAPEGMLTPMSASLNGYPNPMQHIVSQQQANMNGYTAPAVLAGGDSSTMGMGSMSNEPIPHGGHLHNVQQQHSAFMTPSTQQRQSNPSCANTLSACTPKNVQPTSICETPRTHSTAVRRINLFADPNSTRGTNEKTSADFTTPVRLEPRVRGPDNQYKQSKTPAASQQMRFLRTPPSDTKSLPPGRPKKVRACASVSNDSSLNAAPAIAARSATSLVGQFQALQVNGGAAQSLSAGDVRSGSVMSLELVGSEF